MRIAITYDLRDEYLAEGFDELETAEFDSVETIDAIDEALLALGHVTDRIGRARRLAERLADGEGWDLVFNICEGLGGVGREAQVPVLLDLYGIPYTFAEPAAMVACLHKGLAKSIAAAAGVRTADFAVIETLDDLHDAAGIDRPGGPRGYPRFVKPLAEGTGKGVSAASIVHDDETLAAACSRLLAAHRQPVLVETFLPGREFTVGILGTGAAARVLGTMEVILRDRAEPGAYSYGNKANWREVVTYRHWDALDDPVVAEAEAMALKAWRVLHGRDGGRVDLRCDGEGRPHLLEVNPLAGLHPTHSDLPIIATDRGIPYVAIIAAIVASAAERFVAGGDAFAAAVPVRL